MAVLEKIRVKFGLAISIIIALALLSFIVDVNTLESALNVMSSKNDVGEINGKSISYTDFQSDLDRLTTINQIVTGSSASNETTQNQIRNAAWQELIYKYLFVKNAKAAGINVGTEEQKAITIGDYTSAVIAQDPIFADETGAFSKENLISLVQNMDADASGQIRTYWDYVTNSANLQQYYLKYADLFMQSNFQNPLMLRNAVSENNSTTNVDFVMVAMNPYITDSTVVVSSNDIRNYYNNHKSFFKQNASRDIEYVVYEVKPSDADIAETSEKMTDLYEEFSTTSTMKNFLLKNSDRPYSEYWYKNGELSTINAEVNQFVSENNAGVSPVIRDNNTFYMARIMDVAQRADSVYVKHILLQDANAAAKADSLVGVLAKGGNFANLAAENSIDQSSMADGELGSIGWMTQNYMISGFESVLTAELNKPFVLTTSYGTHVVLVTKKTKPVTMKQVAILEKETLASKETFNVEYAKANDFATMANGSYENYKKAVDELGVYSHVVNNVLESTSAYGAIDQAKEVTRWIFDAKKGKVSNIITVNNNYFFIATLKDIHKEGYATVEEAASVIRQQLYAEKYAEKMEAEVKEKIAGLTTLEAIAEKLGTSVSSQNDVTFSSMTSQGLDPKFIGAISSSPVGQICGPVAGTIGVYVYQVTGHDTGAFYTEDDAKTYKAQENSYFAQSLVSVMMNDADVKDNRARFF